MHIYYNTICCLVRAESLAPQHINARYDFFLIASLPWGGKHFPDLELEPLFSRKGLQPSHAFAPSTFRSPARSLARYPELPVRPRPSLETLLGSSTGASSILLPLGEGSTKLRREAKDQEAPKHAEVAEGMGEVVIFGVGGRGGATAKSLTVATQLGASPDLLPVYCIGLALRSSKELSSYHLPAVVHGKCVLSVGRAQREVRWQQTDIRLGNQTTRNSSGWNLEPNYGILEYS